MFVNDLFNKKNVTEDQLDEISKTTLGSYVKKAADDAVYHANVSGFEAGEIEGGRKAKGKLPHGNTSDAGKVEKKRTAGISKAVNRLVKENTVEDTEQIDEISLGNYRNKAKIDRANRELGYHFGDQDERDIDMHKIAQRSKGIARADVRVAKAKTAVPVLSSDERTALQAQLADLEKQFDSNYEYSDDHRVWTKHRGIEQQINRIKHQLNDGQQSVAEVTGDEKFDSMMKRAAKAPTAKARNAERIRQKKEREDDTRAHFANGGGLGTNPADKLSIRKKGVAEDRENYNGINILLQKDDDEVFVKASAGGRELGHVLFTIDGEHLMPQDLEVDEKYRGQGIAQTMYDFVKSKGYRIRRSGQQTDAGAGFWDKHRPEQNVWEQGVAEGDDPYAGYSDNDMYFVNLEKAQREKEFKKIQARLQKIGGFVRKYPDSDVQMDIARSVYGWLKKGQDFQQATVLGVRDYNKSQGVAEAGSPAQQAAIAIAMKKAGKKPKNEGEGDPWKEKYFGPTTAIKKIFSVKTDDNKKYRVRAETEKQAIEIMKKHAPDSNVMSVKFVQNIMSEQNMAEDLNTQSEVDMGKWMKAYTRREDNNLHSENTVAVAKLVGDERDIKLAKMILKDHLTAGSISRDDYDARQMLDKKLWSRVIQKYNDWEANRDTDTIQSGSISEDIDRYVEELLSEGYEVANEEHQQCPECGGVAYDDKMIAEEKDACYHKVKSRYKIWPSAYASGALVKCRKAGAKNWGNKSKK